MQLFYNPILSNRSTEITFNKLESNHIIKVLRKKEGDILHITNGMGYHFKATITFANPKKCVATICEVNKIENPKNYYLHIAIAPTKLNSRFEWFLEKVTEIGIDEITPILCEHSERKLIKHERMEKIMIAAAKQSLKFHFPKLNKMISFSDFLNRNNKGDLFIAHCEDEEKQSLKNKLRISRPTTILIGPEGDFSINEIKLSLKNNFQPISLGNNRLRTETAGVVAAHSVAFFNE